MDIEQVWAEVSKWVSTHPLPSAAGGAFLLGFLVYIFSYSRLGLLLRLLLGLATIGLGVFFAWSLLQTFDLGKLTPVAGGVLGVLFVLTLLDDILDGSDMRGQVSGGGFRIWDRRD